MFLAIRQILNPEGHATGEYYVTMSNDLGTITEIAKTYQYETPEAAEADFPAHLWEWQNPDSEASADVVRIARLKDLCD